MMNLTPRKINWFLLLKLPSAFITGVRVVKLSSKKATVVVRLKWINQNPFKSMFWAVQGMASELATGVLIMQHINKTDFKISMLVTAMKAEFLKKAKGKVCFECNEGLIISKILTKAIKTREGQKIVLKLNGVDEDGVIVSCFEYEWSVKVKE